MLIGVALFTKKSSFRSDGPYYMALRRPLYWQSRQRLPLSPTVWANFGALLMQKFRSRMREKVAAGVAMYKSRLDQ